ncbi:MAG: hypothetical protein M1816_004525 [Peltula sp. TS41687]|nr:MAG: hypothetical protein M1816_004525 [Peltula sp. TS41687]
MNHDDTKRLRFDLQGDLGTIVQDQHEPLPVSETQDIEAAGLAGKHLSLIQKYPQALLHASPPTTRVSWPTYEFHHRWAEELFPWIYGKPIEGFGEDELANSESLQLCALANLPAMPGTEQP